MVAIWTGLSRDLDPDGEEAIRKTSTFWKNHDQGAATVLVAALDPALNGKCFVMVTQWVQLIKTCKTEPKGIMLHDCQMCEAAPHATDPRNAERLWTLSEQLVQTDFKL